MNLNYGVFSNFIKLLYAIGMVVNLVMQLIPMLELIESRQPSIFGFGTSPNENTDRSIHVYLYDPNTRSWCQAITKFINTLVLVVILLLLTVYFNDFHLLLLIDGAVLSNVLMLMLPNALYLHQTNYGYLKYRESAVQYFLANFLFYLSIFNMIYASFRGLQQCMGELGVKSIVN